MTVQDTAGACMEMMEMKARSSADEYIAVITRARN
jgi:hypothetical protein